MPKAYEMSWVPGQLRWTKRFGGRTFSVSCRQLGCPPTKQASYLKANAWWRGRQQEVEAASRVPADPPTVVVRDLLEQASVGDLRRLAAQGEAAGKLLAILGRASAPANPKAGGNSGVGALPSPEVVPGRLADGGTIPRAAIDAVLGDGLADVYPLTDEERLDELNLLAARVVPAPRVAADRTVGGQAEGWLRVQHARVTAGDIEAGRYGAYKAGLGIFRRWAGDALPVQEIDAVRLEQFHARLLELVGERRLRGRPHGCSPGYAQGVWATVKMFVTRLAEHGLLTRPANLTRLKIRVPDAPITTYTVEEVRTLLDGCSEARGERTGLYLLLMVNCGMYQSDVSDLVDDEVDWAAGTVTRPRSKTRDRGGKAVTYALWPETFALLTKCRNRDRTIRDEGGRVRVLVTAAGGPLVSSRMIDGRHSRTDNIKSAYRRLCDRLGLPARPLMNLRKTSATLFQDHPTYKFYSQHFLAHSPRSVTDRRYVVPSREEFFAATDWLRGRYGFGE